MKYQVKGEWTKETVKEQIRKYNNGTKSINGDRLNTHNQCVYLAPDGNRCAAGCFLVDLYSESIEDHSIMFLMEQRSEIASAMPLDVYGMNALQEWHDGAKVGFNFDDMRDYLCDWIENNVIEGDLP